MVLTIRISWYNDSSRILGDIYRDNCVWGHVYKGRVVNVGETHK